MRKRKSKTMNDLQNDDSSGSMPGDSTCDPVARMRARLSCYIARRWDGLDDSLDPDDPDGLAHKIGQIASHLDQSLSLSRELSSFPPGFTEALDRCREAGGVDAYFASAYPDTIPCQPVPTTPDSEQDS